MGSSVLPAPGYPKMGWGVGARAGARLRGPDRGGRPGPVRREHALVEGEDTPGRPRPRRRRSRLRRLLRAARWGASGRALRYVGAVESGVGRRTVADAIEHGRQHAESPFADLRRRHGTVWLDPTLTTEVAVAEIVQDGCAPVLRSVD